MSPEDIDAEAHRILAVYVEGGYPEAPHAENDLHRLVVQLNGHEATRVVDVFQADPLGRNVLAYALMRWGVFEEEQLQRYDAEQRKLGRWPSA